MEVNSQTNYQSLQQFDPDMKKLIEEEEYRQFTGLELVASENYTSQSVYECLGSCFTNKYSEGYPGNRYYGGAEIVDKMENLCMSRALKAYGLDDKEWGVNVQPYSGSPANMAALLAVIKPGDRIMGMDLPSGGHLTHGYQTETRKISHTSVVFESKPYKVDQKTGLLDYDQIAQAVLEYKPHLLFAGYSAYPRDLDYKKFREIADSVGAILFVDMAHYSGLVATKVFNSPFEYADIVSSTTHKTLRGPRSGMVFFKTPMREKINFSVFPGLQGGPHNHQIAALATQLKEVDTEYFRNYIKQVQSNARKIAEEFIKKGHTIVTGGTDNHIVMYDCRPKQLTGSKVEKACDLVHITLNKNAVVGDKSALTPGGIRIGTPAITTRGMKEDDMVTLVDILDRLINLCCSVQTKSGKALKDFLPALEKHEDIVKIREDVKAFATRFTLPGICFEKYVKK